MLDRMVGYKISPLLWQKVKRGLSAGRVQSVVLRLIGDREDEINAFIPDEYWSLDAHLKVTGEKKVLEAKFYGTENEKITIHSKEEVEKIRAEIEKDRLERQQAVEEAREMHVEEEPVSQEEDQK